MTRGILLFAPLVGFVFTSPAAAWPLGEREADQVVFLGNTLIEREQRHGYWEAALTARYPTRKITFRNLGWSGDTVFGDARAGFGSTADGFRHLRDHVLVVKPSVLIIGYGINESFAGPAGLPKFVKGLETLLDAVGPAKAKDVILLSPLRQEDLGRPLPDPSAQNKNLRLYADAIRDVAKKRELAFVDLYDLLPDGNSLTPPAPLTNNGIHLTVWGYWRSAFVVEKGLGLNPRPWHVEVGKEIKAAGTNVEKLPGESLKWKTVDEVLPLPAPPAEGAPKAAVIVEERVLVVKDLKPGKYLLTIDGKEIALASEKDWQAGVRLTRGPEFDQAEKLRQAIVVKNELYFHRWRPQNETYLFGFRKHEQGKNAREIPQFDPLVEAKEAEIRKLATPLSHVYELRPATASRP